MALKKTITTGLGLALWLGLLAGCASDEAGQKEQSPEPCNIAGIYRYTPHCYNRVSPTTIDLRSSDLSADTDCSGDQTQWLWGAITYSDY